MNDTYFINLCRSLVKEEKLSCIIVDKYNSILLNSVDREHPEFIAICDAARNGVMLNETRMYSLWYPCYECSKMIINAGIREVILDPEHEKHINLTDQWIKYLARVKDILKRNGVSLRLAILSSK
jgi:deoxycytidylate deaminase